MLSIELVPAVLSQALILHPVGFQSCMPLRSSLGVTRLSIHHPSCYKGGVLSLSIKLPSSSPVSHSSLPYSPYRYPPNYPFIHQNHPTIQPYTTTLPTLHATRCYSASFCQSRREPTITSPPSLRLQATQPTLQPLRPFPLSPQWER